MFLKQELTELEGSVFSREGWQAAGANHAARQFGGWQRSGLRRLKALLLPAAGRRQ